MPLTLSEKAQEVLRLTKEIVAEAKTLENKQIAGLFRVFGDEHFVNPARQMVEWLGDIE